MLKPRSRADDGVVVLEFAMVAPIFLLMIMGVCDLGQAFICWQETETAAEDIAFSADTLLGNNPNMDLTVANAEGSMTELYGVIPWLQSTGYAGTYSATLSGLQFQGGNAYITFSAPMTEGTSAMATVRRACGQTQQLGTYPEDATTLNSVPTLNLTPQYPQIIADVHVQFRPYFYRFIGNLDFWATQLEPIPNLNSTGATQTFTYDGGSSSDPNNCQNSPPS